MYTIPPTFSTLIQGFYVLILYIFLVIPLTFVLLVWDFGCGIFNKKLDDHKIILITGASSGIGADIARVYAKPGVTLGLLARNESKLNEVAQECEAKGAECEILKVDISDIENLKKALENFDDEHPIDLLISNAAQISTTVNNPEQTGWEDSYKKLFEVNYLGNVATVMTIYKRMKQRKRGQIAITSSLVSYFSVPNLCFYNSTKSALTSFARDLSCIAKPYNVNVSVIAPGSIATDMTIHLSDFLRASSSDMAKVIKCQLENNVFFISWPFYQNISAFGLSTLPVRINLLFTNISKVLTKVVLEKPIFT